MSNTRSTTRPLFGLYGASGCGRSVMPVAECMLEDRFGKDGFELLFVDDAPTASTVNGRRVLHYEEFIAEEAASKAIAIAIASSGVRKELADRCIKDAVPFFSVRSPHAVIMHDVQVGSGALISPFVTLTSNIRIGLHFHANLYSYVEHDCDIGDFVTFAPGVQCNGNVKIEDGAYLGAGCIIKQGHPGEPLVIGRGAVVGMGAIVTRSVAPGDTVVGNPARQMRRQ